MCSLVKTVSFLCLCRRSRQYIQMDPQQPGGSAAFGVWISAQHKAGQLQQTHLCRSYSYTHKLIIKYCTKFSSKISQFKMCPLYVQSDLNSTEGDQSWGYPASQVLDHMTLFTVFYRWSWWAVDHLHNRSMVVSYMNIQNWLHHNRGKERGHLIYSAARYCTNKKTFLRQLK